MEVNIMVAVKEFSWEEVSAPDFENSARRAWREAVAAIADKAKAKLPECNGRVDKAVALVLNGEVELLPDGAAKVASQSNGSTAYHVVNGHCDCRDYEKAPGQLCKHRLSAAIARRAQELTKATLDTPATSQPPPAQPAAPTAPLPEAPVSITLKATLHGHEVLVTLRGVDFASVKAQVEDASQWLQAQSGHTADDTPQCPKHGAMKPSTKGKGWYCPHKLADGSWCKSK
jgi:SWIM zinc finger